MEKLRELLNEFDPYIQKDGEHRDCLWYSVICGESAVYWKENGIQKIISKEYGFIKRLVDHNKIDFDKVMKLGIPCFVRYDNGEIISVHDVDFDRQLIMLLSISDSPIEDLISYLK